MHGELNMLSYLLDLILDPQEVPDTARDGNDHAAEFSQQSMQLLLRALLTTPQEDY